MRLAPTVCTREIASIHIGCHLHATAALNAVERALVAVTIVLQLLLGPVADFNTTVFANEVIRGPVGFVLDEETRAEVDRRYDRLLAVLD